MAWHPTKDLLAFLHAGKLLLLDVGAKKTTVRELPIGKSGARVKRIAFSRKGNLIVASVAAEDSRMEPPFLSAILLIPLGGEQPLVVPPPAGVKLGEVVLANWRTAWQPTGDFVIAYGAEQKTGSQVFVKIPTSGKAATVAGTVKGQMWIVAAGSDTDQAIALVEDANTPPDFYCVGPDFKVGTRLSRIEPRLCGVSIGPVEIFETEVPTGRGEKRTVRSAVALPPGGKKGQKFPTIVTLYPGADLSHQARSFGGGAVSTIPAGVFTTRGYAVLLVDVPLAPLGVPSNPRQEITDIVLPQVKRAAELGYTDIGRVGVTGHSYGGYGTACLVCSDDLFKAAVPMSGIYDLAGLYATQPVGAPETEGMTYSMIYMEMSQGRMGKPLWDEPRRYLDNSPYFQANRIRTPMLIVHGRDDRSSPAGEAEKLFNSLVRLKRTAQLAIYTGEGHVPTEWRRENLLDLCNRTLKFFDRYLKTDKESGK
jgi:dipeptidyl aminopeptidase/acylaminoacyl peptidase